MDPYLKQQLRQVVAVASPTSLDAAGQVQVGSAATFFCRYESSYREIPVYGGVEERTVHTLILSEDFNLTEQQARNALYWLPGFSVTDATVARRAKTVEMLVDEYGNLDHFELTL